MPLDEYRRKRHFAKTPEPEGKVAPKKKGGLAFVVQKHAASRLHYDFRLEHDGVLLSWAVPKGPSLDPADKRLAVRVEDHPLAYAGFQGVIPAGEYGGGGVIVWDRGTWEPEGDATAMLAAGRLRFRLDGEKLSGTWNLVRSGGRSGGDKNWLLIKSKDEAARPRSEGDVLEERPESVLDGRTVEEVAATSGKVTRGGKAVEAKAVKAKAPKLKTPKKAAKRSPLSDDAPAHLSSIRLTSPDKVLDPASGVTKLDLVGYYTAIADWILPQVAGRPLTLVRCPDGTGAECFVQKHADRALSRAVKRLRVAGVEREQLVVRDLAGLAALVQAGVMEIHVWGSRADRPDRPDRLVFDLDPDAAVPWADVVESAFLVRDRLQDLGLASWAKTTGGKGLHVVVPVERRHGWDEAKAFTRRFAERVAAEFPKRFLATASKAARKGKIYLDYLRNAQGATAVAAYSPRARAGAPVATPVSWEELAPDLDPKTFDVRSVPGRLAALEADPWAGMDQARQSIAAAARKGLGL